MKGQETKEIISTEILNRMHDQSAAQVLKAVLVDKENNIDWEKAGFSIIEHMPELKLFG